MKTEQAEQRVEKESFLTQRIVIKIGSSTICEGGTHREPLNIPLIEDIARQTAILYKSGVEVIIVSSGAVVCGRNLLKFREHDTVDRQMEAAYGQPYLMRAWIDAFAKEGIKAAQFLITQKDMDKAKFPLAVAVKYGIPIINENDSVSTEEMKKFEETEGEQNSADNDISAKLIAYFVGADTLVLLTDQRGVMDNAGNLIENGAIIDVRQIIGASAVGIGGMKSKVSVAQEAANKLGISTFIAGAAYENVILEIAKGKYKGRSTAFLTPKS